MLYQAEAIPNVCVYMCVQLVIHVYVLSPNTSAGTCTCMYSAIDGHDSRKQGSAVHVYTYMYMQVYMQVVHVLFKTATCTYMHIHVHAS